MKSSHQINIRIRYSETDQMGVVYHGNYAQYLEMGRVEWLRNLGISYRWMEDNGVMLPVISLMLRYKKPAKYDDVITVKTTLLHPPGVKIEFGYIITSANGDVLVEGNTQLAFIDIKTGRPTRCPEYILKLLKDETF